MKLSNQTYDILNFISRKLPLLATFYVAIAKLWSLPYPAEISGTILAVSALLNGFLDHSSAEYYKSVAEANEYFQIPEEDKVK